MNLIYQAKLEDQTIKILIFRRLHSKDQDQIMLVSSIKTENEFQKETVENYLERIIRLLRRKEICWKIGENNSDDGNTENVKSIWNQEKDPMDLNQTSVDKRKCFKCEKTDHIRRFCRKKTLISVKSENEKTPVSEEDQKEEESL